MMFTNNLYHPTPIEWLDRRGSDLLYVPPNFIEIQNSVYQAFMIRSIQYCTRVFERYKVVPVVLIFVVEKFSNKELEKKKKQIQPKINASYLIKTLCEFRAQASIFMPLKTIENHIKVDMNQLVALVYFITS